MFLNWIHFAKILSWFKSHKTIIQIMFFELNLFGKNMLIIRILQDHDLNKKLWLKSCFESEYCMIQIILNQILWFKSYIRLIRVNCVEFDRMTILCMQKPLLKEVQVQFYREGLNYNKINIKDTQRNSILHMVTLKAILSKYIPLNWNMSIG